MVDPALVRRRTAISGVLGGLAVAALASGCDHGDDLAPPSAGPSSATTTPSSQAPEQTPDEVLVDEVLGTLTTALAVLTSSRKAPELRQVLAPLTKAHRQHVNVLEGDLPDESPPGPPPDAVAALRAVRRSEQQLRLTLVDGANRAESGALARLLASMSASVTQHLTVLPTEVAP